MNKKKTYWIISLIVLATPIFLIYMTFSNSLDCSQLVIDTYEIHSGINIPEVEFVNCYYDEDSNTRISVYELNTKMGLSKFKSSKFSSLPEALSGYNLLSESERPDETQLYLASGEKWGTKWTYLVDNNALRLWAELKYEN